MYHSLIFMDGATRYHTWDNWYLIPSQRPVVAEPTRTFKYVEVPGRSGAIDMTDFLSSEPIYSDCTGSFTFYVDHDARPKNMTWADHKDLIASVLDGRKMKMYLEDDPGYYYEGRFILKTWNPGSTYSQVSIEYHVGPKKILDANGGVNV